MSVKYLTIETMGFDFEKNDKLAKGLGEVASRFNAEVAGGCCSLPKYPLAYNTVVIAKEDDQVIGFAAAHVNYGDEWVVGAEYVLPEYRGTGCGRKIGEEMLAHAKSRGARTIVASSKTPTVVRGLTKMGFTGAREEGCVSYLRLDVEK